MPTLLFLLLSLGLLSCNRPNEFVKTGDKFSLIESRTSDFGTNLFGKIRIDSFRIQDERYITSSQMSGGEWIIDEVLFKGILKESSGVFFECYLKSGEESLPIFGISDQSDPETVLYAWMLSVTGVKFTETDAAKVSCAGEDLSVEDK